MSHIWTFSPSSEPLLQRCIEAALLQETENKWTQKFGRKTVAPLTKSEDKTEGKACPATEMAASLEEQQKNEVSESHDDFFDILEQEVRLDFVTKECSKNPDLFIKMAQRLPVNTVEKLFKLIFSSEDVDNDFLAAIFHKFLPLYIKLKYSSVCLDMLTKTNEKYPKIFQTLVQILFEDIETPNQVLNNLISTFDETKLTNFIVNLTNLNLTSEVFVHNILTIYTAYKNCVKTENIQNWICTNLLKHGHHCNSDRNYGRLFLLYLQTEKLLGHTISKKLAECLEEHHSPYKRPCTMLVKELLQK